MMSLLVKFCTIRIYISSCHYDVRTTINDIDMEQENIQYCYIVFYIINAVYYIPINEKLNNREKAYIQEFSSVKNFSAKSKNTHIIN